MTNSMQAAQATPSSPAQPRSSAEIRDQIKQSILAAQDAAREAAREGARAGADGQVFVGPGHSINAPAFPPGVVFQTESGSGFPRDGIPPQVEDISIAFFVMCAVIAIGWPLARAFGRRLEGRGASAPALNAATTEQLHRIEQAVDAMAIEVERISESQRFIAKMQNAQLPNRELKSS